MNVSHFFFKNWCTEIKIPGCRDLRGGSEIIKGKKDFKDVDGADQIAHLLRHEPGRLHRLSDILRGSPERLDDLLGGSIYIFCEADPKEEAALDHPRPPIQESIVQEKALKC